MEILSNNSGRAQDAVPTRNGTSAAHNGVCLTSRQAAATLGVCLRTLGNLRRRRDVPFIKLGRLVRYRQDALESALNAHSTEAVSRAGEQRPDREVMGGMRRRSKDWPRITVREYRTGRLKYVVNLGKQGSKNRDRRTFDTQKEADDFAVQVRAACEEQGQLPFVLPHEMQSQAVAFYRFMEQHDLGDFNSVRQHYEKDIIPYLGAPNLFEIAERMLEEMEVAKGDRDISIKAVRGIVNEFCAYVGAERKITDIKPNEVSDFIFKPGRTIGARTKKNRRAIVSQFFNFAIRNEWAAKNLAGRLPLPRIVHKKERPLSVDECWRLLTHANQFGMLRFATAVLLSGVRTEETQKTPRKPCREEEGIIEIPEYASKTGVARDVEVNETAAAWFSLCDPADVFLADKRNFHRQFKAWRKAAGIEPWPRNALRRTFASYHYATFKDPKATAHRIGHVGGERILFKHYIVHVPEKEAKRLWTLRPPVSSDIGRQAA